MSEKRVIVALDVPSLDEAGKLIYKLAPHVASFKIGLELLSAVGGPVAANFVTSRMSTVFLDGKFKDIPNTVAGAARAVTRLAVWGFTVHVDGGTPMLEAAVRATEQAYAIDGGGQGFRPLVIGITVLTSLDYDTLAEVGVVNGLHASDADDMAATKRRIVQDLVVQRARVAQRAGLDAVVASPQEAALVRDACGPTFLIITPGVRPAGADAADQKRVATPAEAIRNGADYLVIGRPVIEAPDPVAALQAINDEIEQALTARRK